METSTEINELAAALAKAQGEIENAGKNAKNPHFKSTYADLSEVLNVARPVLSKHGLSIVQMPVSSDDSKIGVITRLMHSSGQYIQSSLDIKVGGNNPAHAAGSAITYLRRYSAAAFVGIAQEDKDANDVVPAKVVNVPDEDLVAMIDSLPTECREKMSTWDGDIKSLTEVQKRWIRNNAQRAQA